MQDGIYFHQGLERQRTGFLGGRFGFGQQAQRLQISRLDAAPAIQIDHETIGDTGKIAARMLWLRWVADSQNAQIGIVGKVCCVEGIAQFFVQPAPQPAMMVAVEGFDFLRWGVGRGHKTLAGRLISVRE